MPKTFGVSTARLEDPDLLRGRGRFVDDIHLPGMLELAFVRSSHAHALIRKIDTAAARAVAGVHAVYTMNDLRPRLGSDRLVVALPSPSYRQRRDRPVLAIEEVTYVGEAVAVVIAENRYIAEDAAQLVDIEYAPLPAIADCRDALRPGVAVAHRDAKDNLLAQFDMSYGDIDAAFMQAPYVFRESLWQHRGGGHSIECRGVVAVHDALDDLLTLWSSTQTPHAAKGYLCDLLGRDENRIRVVAPDIGGGFGPKLVFYPEEVVAAVAALMLGRPVKWIEDRREHFSATTQERDQYWDIEIAVDGEARILGVRGQLIHDHGAYTARGVNVPYGSASALVLPYIVPAYRLDVLVALTNKVPVTPVRGAGQPQGVFAIERLLDRVARELGLDRIEVRRRNLVPAQKMPYRTPLKTRGGMQVVLDSGDYPQCQQAACTAIGWDRFPERQAQARAQGRYLGIGIANIVEGTGRGPYEPVTVRIAPSGKVHIYSGAVAMGQGTRTMLAQIVAEQLGGEMSNMTVTAGDTAGIALGMGGFNSRQAVIAGSSAHAAALKVRDKALAIAGHLLEVTPDDLEIEADRIQVKGVAGIGVTLGQVARAAAGQPGFKLPGGLPPGLEATEHVVIDDMTYANATGAAEVEVDIDSGMVRVHRFILVHDCGRAIHPMIVEGQIHGGIAHGIGNSLFEWMGYDETAQPLTTNYGEYLLITSTEMPKLEVIHKQSPTPLNPLGIKGVGECGVMPAAAAIVSAIEDALSPFAVRVAQTPISPPQLLALIQQACKRAGREERDV